MPSDEQFVTEVVDRFCVVDSVTSRKIFGGHGIFHNGLMIALIADNELYLKADKESEHWFNDEGLAAFSYQKPDGKVFRMSYFQASESFFEDDEETRVWTQRAIDAAIRAPKKPKRTSKSRPASTTRVAK